ncbi:tetratricopeptide repeat protein [Adhaeribacter soli]|uniref:Tetratricopeptide repeat protein n=1 Tax=Adhaeribacter soli TaxID=2607655 RepID=A0A5N1J7F0_9BACT|nr:hypothetical protein [Adhaeribacter soli]KAA9345892.1 hypothetical protein F0P94_02075 [Adhaeribacter soli]
MKKLYILSMVLLPFASCSQDEKPSDKAFKVFNEGVKFSLDAGNAASINDYEKASQLNKKAIEKFKETLTIDSTHSWAVSALAHSQYLEKNYREAIPNFEKAIKVQPNFAVNYQEMGMCKINLGEIEDGKRDLVKAFSLDPSVELKTNTILDLQDIGRLAFDYGDGYINQGEKDKGEGYKRFAIAVFLLAFDFDKNKESAKLVSDYALKIGDKDLSEKFKLIAQ